MKESIEEVSKETKRFLDNQRSLYVATGNKNRKMRSTRRRSTRWCACRKSTTASTGWCCRTRATFFATLSRTSQPEASGNCSSRKDCKTSERQRSGRLQNRRRMHHSRQRHLFIFSFKKLSRIH